MFAVYFVISTYTVLLIHELGHFVVARVLNVIVATVCVGIGPQLFKYIDARGTSWHLRLFPVAAFCILDWGIKRGTNDDEPIGPKAKIAVLAGGPLVSLASGWVLLNYSIFTGLPSVITFNGSIADALVIAGAFSISVGLFNSLPLPFLDGGQICREIVYGLK